LHEQLYYRALCTTGVNQRGEEEEEKEEEEEEESQRAHPRN